MELKEIIIIILIDVVIGGLISFFFAKDIIKWYKQVKVIDKKNNFWKSSTKLTGIVELITLISKKYNMPMPEIGVYPSREVSAFATGRRNNSLIAFSSGLVNSMDMTEIRGVIAHNCAHLINYDLAKIIIIKTFVDISLRILNVLFFSWIRKKDDSEKKRSGNSYLYMFFLPIYRLLGFFLHATGLILVFAFVRGRELKADRVGAKIIGIDNMINTLKKLLSLEKGRWIVDNLDLSEEEEFQLEKEQLSEPNSVQVTKFNPQKNRFLELFRTHPPLQKRISILENLRKNLEQ